MATRGSYVHISMGEFNRGHPDNISFTQFFTKIRWCSEQDQDSQGFENSWHTLMNNTHYEKFCAFSPFYTKTILMALKDKFMQSENVQVFFVHSILFCVWVVVCFFSFFLSLQHMALVKYCWAQYHSDIKQTCRV